MIARQSSISALIAALMLVLAPGCGGGHDGAAAGSAAARLPETVRFNRDVRPILTDKCFACHGPDANQRQADLRLDVRDSALSDRKGVHAIVPGDVTHSELVRRISSSDPEYRMPPPRSNRTLGPREIALLTKWVKQGAEYEPHWAYAPLHRPVPPPVKDTQWVENPIDQFVLARLEQHGVDPLARRRSLHARPPAELRHRRPAAQARASRRLRAQREAVGVRRLRRSPAGITALRRTDGGVLARPGPLRGHQRLQRGSAPPHLSVPRLRDPRLQRRHAVRRVHHRAAGRRPAARADALATRGLGVQPPEQGEHGKRQPGEGVPGQVRRRPGAHDGDRLDGGDVGVRRVPRPQVRSLHVEGLLQLRRLLRRRRRSRRCRALGRIAMPPEIAVPPPQARQLSSTS